MLASIKHIAFTLHLATLIMLAGVSGYPRASIGVRSSDLALRGVGSQFFSCQGGKWVSVGAEAQLSGPQGGTVGHHHFSNGMPVFELGSMGTVVARKTGSSPGQTPQDAPWLTLAVVSGPFRTVTRTQTHGGAAPTSPCSPGQQNHAVNYDAIYTFSG